MNGKDNKETENTETTPVQEQIQAYANSVKSGNTDTQQQAAPQQPAPQQSQPQQPQQTERMFTQSEVSSLAAKEKNQGRNAVYNELGINPADKELIALVKSLTSARSTTGTVEAGQELEVRALEAERRATIAEMKMTALSQGANAQYVDDIVTLALAKIDADENVEFSTVLGEIRAKYPTFFGSNDEPSKENIGQHGTGSSVGGSKTPGEDANKGAGLGTRLAAQRRSSVSKSSFFND